MLDMWKSLAASQHVTLIAPDFLDASPNLHSDGEAFLSHVLTEAEKNFSVDRNRIYLFGHSAGAILALHLANNPGPWRAVAVHAGGPDTSQLSRMANAPAVRIYLGEKDHIFYVDDVRQGAKAMASVGHRTELVVIRNHTHWYYKIGRRLAAHAWEFLHRQ
jgi:poly(3-hydroxybutyrate) depolymerase